MTISPVFEPDAEWLVANGLGGYASGTIAGPSTRRYHGLLVAALAAPLGRVVMLDRVHERVALDAGGAALDLPSQLRGFRLDAGLPVWIYETPAGAIEKTLFMPHGTNSLHVVYRSFAGAACTLLLTPWLKPRSLPAPVDVAPGPQTLRIDGERYAIDFGPRLPPLRLRCSAPSRFVASAGPPRDFFFAREAERGYAASGRFPSPGTLAVELAGNATVTLLVSVEPQDIAEGQAPGEALDRERRRRFVLAGRAGSRGHAIASQLAMAADAFVITPGAVRAEPHARVEPRSVIAGYHWFTDWGRDTMIGLEGLTLVTGRHDDARRILLTFASYMRDGLIPNLFPEGGNHALYHTADATLWFFHALGRYLDYTGDGATLRVLLPRLVEAFEAHVHGTRFGIGVDPRDGLLHAGSPDHPLTWMDAQVDGWIVTPRRGKPVEVNALWYNALRLIERWLDDAGRRALAREARTHARRVRFAFNARYAFARGGHLYDVVDGEHGDDPSFRPNQIFAIALPHAVLAPARWPGVLLQVRDELLTPRGLRTLAPDDPAYCPRYDGDRRHRDAAYHQGTVWPWLLGPFCDAWRRAFPHDAPRLRALVDGMTPHLFEAGIGHVSEIFDAEPPYSPRGCIAQAWSVAELLRARAALERAAGRSPCMSRATAAAAPRPPYARSFQGVGEA
jgi:predicted glycogen debranching enzyme